MTEKTAKEKTISIQYAELNRFGQQGDYDRALKAANKSELSTKFASFKINICSFSVLGLAANESLAFHCKIVCFMHLSKFEEAISLINKNPQFAQLSFQFNLKTVLIA